MKVKNCIGCGLELQYQDKNKEGFIPEEKYKSSNKLYCKRCFRLKNYGENINHDFTKEEYKREVDNIVKKCDLIVAIFDIIDFEGSFSDEILDYLRDYNSIVVINKIDLVPGYKHPSELSSWVNKRLSEESIVPYDVAYISTKNNYGINGMLRKINSFSKDKLNVAVLGVTNVGKSSFINKLIDENKLTISKYPGTTIKSIKHEIKSINVDIYDTPGLVPKGRLSDLISEEEGLKLIPSNEISRKTYKLSKDDVFMFDGLSWFEVLNEEKAIFSAYASENVKYHLTKVPKVNNLIETDFFEFPSKESRKTYYENLVTEHFEIEKGEELVISGLSWVAVKQGTLSMKLTYNKYTNIVIRDALIISNKR